MKNWLKESFKKIKKLIAKNQKSIFLLIIFLIISVPIVIVIKKYFDSFGWSLPATKGENPRADWGTLGDFFGGVLNPILGFFSFVALLYTVNLQNEQLEEAKESKVIERFEGLFFHMTNQLKSLYDDIDIEKISVKDFISEDCEAVKPRENINKNDNLRIFFMYLYQILKNIDSLPKSIEHEERKKYSNIVRSVLGNKALQLLYLNNLILKDENEIKDEFYRYKKLITDFEMLEHMDFKLNGQESLNYWLVLLSKTYNPAVFGDSYYYKAVKAGYFTNTISSQMSFKNQNRFIDEVLPKNGLYFVEKFDDNFKSMYISFESKGEITLYDYQERLTDSKSLLENFDPFMTIKKEYGLFIANLQYNSVTFKSFTSNSECRQVSLTFIASENRQLITGTYSQFSSEVEHLYANGSLEKIA